MNKKLIFLYNANSGFMNGAVDSLHKFIDPDSYPCKLCALTHGYFGEKKQRKEWLAKTNYEVLFLHKDELQKSGYIGFALPCVLEESDGDVSCKISAKEFAEIQNLDMLIQKL